MRCIARVRVGTETNADDKKQSKEVVVVVVVVHHLRHQALMASFDTDSYLIKNAWANEKRM